MAQPIPTPISRNRNNDQMMYFTRSLVRRRLKNPNATEIRSAKSVIARKWLRVNPIVAITPFALALLRTREAPPADLARRLPQEIAPRSRLPRARHPILAFRAPSPRSRTIQCQGLRHSQAFRRRPRLPN